MIVANDSEVLKSMGPEMMQKVESMLAPKVPKSELDASMQSAIELVELMDRSHEWVKEKYPHLDPESLEFQKKAMSRYVDEKTESLWNELIEKGEPCSDASRGGEL